jgi:CheY-like chemotaxis protein
MSEAVRVLIADDNADVRDVVRWGLEREGIAVVAEAADGDQALALAVSQAPDVVVLDASMPGPPVAELAAAIRAAPSAPGVLVHSGWPASELGPLDVRVVAKGSDPGELAREVVQAAAARRAG